VACLRGQRLYRIPVGADGSVADPTPLFVGQYGRLRTVVAAPDARCGSPPATATVGAAPVTATTGSCNSDVSAGALKVAVELEQLGRRQRRDVVHLRSSIKCVRPEAPTYGTAATCSERGEAVSSRI